MLFFVGTPFHHYTLNALRESGCGGHGVRAVPVGYGDLFAAGSLPGGTYIFTDIERLSAQERRLAAAAYRAMADQPHAFNPINDPARVRLRYGLLRALHVAGLNAFDAYPASGFPRPRRFPVFVRATSTHDAALTGLLDSQAALDQALAGLEAAGCPLDGLLVIEFAGQAARTGVWRRYTAFRVEDDILLDLPVTEDNWMVKSGTIGLADEAMYLDDDALVRTNRHADVLRRAFDLARIRYGRVDFGLVDGRPQIYEINTNPNVPGLAPTHPSPVREASRHFTWARLTARLAALPMEGGPGQAFALEAPLLQEYRQQGAARMAWRP